MRCGEALAAATAPAVGVNLVNSTTGLPVAYHTCEDQGNAVAKIRAVSTLVDMNPESEEFR